MNSILERFLAPLGNAFDIFRGRAQLRSAFGAIRKRFAARVGTAIQERNSVARSAEFGSAPGRYSGARPVPFGSAFCAIQKRNSGTRPFEFGIAPDAIRKRNPETFVNSIWDCFPPGQEFILERFVALLENALDMFRGRAQVRSAFGAI